MKVIIAHSDTKREINGAFNICGSRADLLAIADQIREAVEDGLAYGWVRITGPRQPHLPETPPTNWD